MIKVVGIRFKKAGKIYYFSPGELNINKWQGQQNIQFIVEDVLIGD